MNAKIAETENRPENTAADAPDLRTEVAEIRKELSGLKSYIDKPLAENIKTYIAEQLSENSAFKELKDEVGELKFYLDEELNKSEKKTAELIDAVNQRITDAEEQIVIAQKTAESSNTAADAPDLRAEIKDLHKRIDGLRHYLDTEVKSYVDTEFFKTNAKLKSLEKTYAIKGVDLNEIPEGVVLDAEPVKSSVNHRAYVISDAMTLSEINDVMRRLSRHMEDLPASELSAVTSILTEAAENIKALLDRRHLR